MGGVGVKLVGGIGKEEGKSQCILPTPAFASGGDFDSGYHCASNTNQVTLASRLQVNIPLTPFLFIPLAHAFQWRKYCPQGS